MRIDFGPIKRPLVTVTAATTGLGAALVGVLTSACCVTPVLATFLVGVLGASGLATAARLKPYSGYLIGGSFVLLAYAFWTVYRPASGAAGGECRIGAGRAVRVMLWTSAAFWVAAATGTFLLLST